LQAPPPFLFLLSCGAGASIVFLVAPIATRLRGPDWMREPLGLTLGPQSVLRPSSIPLFGSVPLAALPANLLAAPVAGPITVSGS